MAGGLGGRGAPLHARTRVGQPPDDRPPSGPPDRTPSGAPDPRADCPARHCWVTTPVDGGMPRPGLLLEWRRTAGGWEGRVAYAARLRADRWGAVEEWLPAAAVASVERTAPPTRS